MHVPLMQKALGRQWYDLPKGLRHHYPQTDTVHTELGDLTIEYPSWMQIPLSILRITGALSNRKGEGLPTQVERHLTQNGERWQRSMQYPNGKQVQFSSRLELHNQRDLIEYLNRFLGIRMQAHVQNEALYCHSFGYVLKLGKLKINIPEWLALGEVSMREKAINDFQFTVEYKFQHPVFGQVFRYYGVFNTQAASLSQ